MKKFLYYFLSCTWGVIMTLIGAIVTLVMIIGGAKPKKFGYCIYTESKRSFGGINLGMFFVIGKGQSSVRAHESGHSLQNIVWGPLFPFVIGLPSLFRCWYREWLVNTDRALYWELPPYDSIWFEGQATRWGQKVFSRMEYGK